MEEHSQAFPAIRDATGHLEERLDRLEDRMDRRFEALDDKVSRRFVWMVGIQITILVAVVSAMLARG